MVVLQILKKKRPFFGCSVYSERLIQSFLFPVHRVCIIIYLYVVRYIFVNMCVLIKKINVLANSLIVSYAHQILHNTEQVNDYSPNEHAIIRRRTDNGMTTIIKTTRQTMIHKIQHRKLKIGQHILHSKPRIKNTKYYTEN
jgi:hypothetical protein